MFEDSISIDMEIKIILCRETHEYMVDCLKKYRCIVAAESDCENLNKLIEFLENR